ncbi:RICIN domain-containing protein [Cryobacterium algoricola]|nr:RICIN domain-containing protein [Cryobacterium algoricola]
MTATRPTRSIRSPKRMLTLALALFLTLAGTSVAQATWTAKPSTLSASVAAGTLSVKQSGFSALAHVYLSSPASALSATTPVTVKNNGSVPAQYTLAFAASGGLASAITVQAWVSTVPCPVNVSAAVPGAQNWTPTAPLTGTLAAGASTVYCVSTSITPALRFTSASGSLNATSTLSATVGKNWATTGNSDTATQSLTSMTPLSLAVTTLTDHSLTVSWKAPADASTVAGYQVYRVGTSTPIATVTSLTALSYVDTGLNVGTSYSYYVVAIDSNGNASPATASIGTSTSGISGSAWYKVKIAGTETCIDGEKELTASGTLLIFFGCKATSFDNQAWQFVLGSGTNYTIRAKYVTNRYWDLTGTGNVNADIQTFDGSSSQIWSVVPITGGNGTFTIKNVQTNKCLDNVNTLTAQGDIQVVAKTCIVGSATQAFTLTNVG